MIHPQQVHAHQQAATPEPGARREPFPRSVGRPRSFSDEDVFRATTGLLLSGGLANATLKHVASRVGFSYQAVAQRFTSKEGLLRGYFDWMLEVVRDDAERIVAEQASNVERLRRLLTLPIDPRIFDTEVFEQEASWTLISLELRRDATLAPIIADALGVYVESLADVVREGQATGELGPGNPSEIAEFVMVAGTGAAMQWLLSPHREPLLAKMERCIDLAIKPYLNQPG